VGFNGCKHAVAVVAEYLQAIADGREVPEADDEDRRWEKIESRGVDRDEWDEDDDFDEDDESWDDDESEPPAARGSRAAKKTGRATPRRTTAVNWDEKIERHIRAKPREELADLAWSLTRRFPEVYQEFRERIALQEGDVAHLVKEARGEIRQVTSER